MTMAYEGPHRRATIDQYQSQFPPQDERDNTQFYGSPPNSSYPPSSHTQYSANSGGRRRSRASSQARSDTSPPRPFHDTASAVNSAFDRSDAAAQVDPALIAQITQQVINTLKETGLGGVAGAQKQPPQQQRPLQTQTSMPIPIDETYAQRNVYAPISPSRHEFPSQTSNSSDVQYREREDSPGNNDVIPTPRYEEMEPLNRTMSVSSSNATTDSTSKPHRPAPMPREPTDNEATTVEKIWQPLFGREGQPTMRLSQFLRGIARHIIDDFEPKKSIVISPAKMLKFYEAVKVPEEVFPWSTVFEKLNDLEIGKMYRDLRCEHYLTQDDFDRVPHIPALTPDGFRTWMTLMITAYPEIEFKRLSKAVLDMPISNADDAKERFPKELSRRLFPKSENLQAQQRCASALSCEGKIMLTKSTTFPPPPPMQPLGSLERERSPYVGAPSDTSASIDEALEEDSPIVTIERERKPYTAKEGSGKLYDENHPNDIPTGARSDSDASRHYRTQPSSSQGGWPIPGATRTNTAEYVPLRPGVNEYPLQPAASRHGRTNSNTSGRPARSSSISTSVPNSGYSYGTRSESNVADIPPGQYASNINMYDHDDDHSWKREYSRRAAEDDAPRASYGGGGSSTRAYDEEYPRGRTGSNGYASRYDNYGQSQPRY